MVLYRKLFDIDKFGHRKAMKKMKPIFQFTKTTMAGNKKHEIIRVAQENLYMLKRLNERTSVYNVDKWNRDYEASQYYKRNHCQYPSIDFYKTQRSGSFGNIFSNFSKNSTKRDFFSRTHYSNGNSFGNSGNANKKKKKFEEFSYRDLQDTKKNNSELGEKNEKKLEFKKISDIDSAQEQIEKRSQENNIENQNEKIKEEEKNN